MSDSETNVAPGPVVSSSPVETAGAGLDECPSAAQKTEKTTARTHTIIIDATSSTSTDVGVQATPAAVSGDTSTPQKSQRGILPVTSDMRNSVGKDSQNHSDNHATATNTKEKTPMCLVNELARFNKIAHKYVLVDENGPAHKKEFRIRLDLGTECYHATGSSIKRAQHAAAEVAISISKLKCPPAKTTPVETPPTTAEEKKKPAGVTPTVELNALAMKLGENPEYLNIDPPTPPMPALHPNYLYPNYYYRCRMPPPMYPHPFMPPHIPHRMTMTCSVVLRLGRHEFRGQGPTRQLARHNAASRALKVLKSLQFQRQNSSSGKNASGTKSDKPDDDTANTSSASEDARASAASPTTTDCSEESNGNCKSEISQVHEMALRLDKTITFDVIHESGPPHMRTFVTRCVCGDLTSDGEGNSKRKSKKVAADAMLVKLKSIEQPTATSKQRVKNIANKKKNRNLIKMQKANVEYGSGINPISRLIQIQQANKRREPVYSLVMEHGLPRRREFIMKVECNEKACQGKGPNKKLAKRNAAEEMLQLMGYSQQTPAPGKSVLKSPDHSSNSHNKHVTFQDSAQSAKVPGVIVRKDVHGNSPSQEMPPFKADLAAHLAKELLEKGKSMVGETLLPAKEHPKYPLKRPREQLEYLGSCMGFAIQFTDFPKGNNTNMCLTVVSLQTNPTQVFHGSAVSMEDSHDKAALQALNQLAQSAGDDDGIEGTNSPTAQNRKKPEENVETKKECDIKKEKECDIKKENDSNAGGDTAIPSTNGDSKHLVQVKNEEKSVDSELGSVL